MELITDRTAADVERAKFLNQKVYDAWLSMAPAAADAGVVIDPVEIAEVALSEEELAEWMAGLKGAYNYTDLNRIGQAIRTVSNLLIAMPEEIEQYRKGKEVYYREDFIVPYNPDEISVSPKVDWSMADPVTPGNTSAILDNISIIRRSFPAGCPAVPSSMARFNFESANNIEKIIQTVYSSAETFRQDTKEKINIASTEKTIWDKYTYTTWERTYHYANISAFSVVFDGQTDETSITGWENYTTEWVDVDGERVCRYVPSGRMKTIYATGNSSGIVYTFPSDYAVERHSLFLINGVPNRRTEASRIETVKVTETEYEPDVLIGTTQTSGYSYPDGAVTPLIISTYMDEVDKLVAGEYYYIRRR